MARADSTLRTNRVKTLTGYSIMIAASVVLFLWVRKTGTPLLAPQPAGGGAKFGHTASGSQPNVLLHVLLAMMVVIAASRGLGVVFRYLQQPPVIGEVIAGVLLGPSLLGRVAPNASAYLLPPTVAPFLGIIGAVFGHHRPGWGDALHVLDRACASTTLLRKKTHSTVAISYASIIAPFCWAR